MKYYTRENFHEMAKLYLANFYKGEIPASKWDRSYVYKISGLPGSLHKYDKTPRLYLYRSNILDLAEDLKRHLEDEGYDKDCINFLQKSIPHRKDTTVVQLLDYFYEEVNNLYVKNKKDNLIQDPADSREVVLYLVKTAHDGSIKYVGLDEYDVYNLVLEESLASVFISDNSIKHEKESMIRILNCMQDNYPNNHFEILEFKYNNTVTYRKNLLAAIKEKLSKEELDYLESIIHG